jgi:uncharacterized membrane protein (UPF0127 family)
MAARAGAVILAAALPLLSCTESEPTGPTATVAIVGGPTFGVEVVDTPIEREQGLSGRAELAAGTGMLFVYDEAQPRRFWMADMLIPIDLAWIRDGRIIGVETLQPCPSREQCPLQPSPGPVDHVLEVPASALAQIPTGAEVMIG